MVRQRLPDLRVGPDTTKSSALHSLRFVGALEAWPDFEEQVWTAYRSHRWRHRVLAHYTRGNPITYLTREYVAVGDEHGVQGRFGQHVGQVMSAILESQGMDLVFGDFKCTTDDYKGVPDVACFDSAGSSKIVGELKTDWIDAHNLIEALRFEERLRVVLG